MKVIETSEEFCFDASAKMLKNLVAASICRILNYRVGQDNFLCSIPTPDSVVTKGKVRLESLLHLFVENRSVPCRLVFFIPCRMCLSCLESCFSIPTHI